MIDLIGQIGPWFLAALAVLLHAKNAARGAASIAGLVAQVEESQRAKDRIVEKYTNKVLAFKSPEAYTQYRQMSGLPEVQEVPVPEHASENGSRPSMRENLAYQHVARLEQQRDELLGDNMDDELR